MQKGEKGRVNRIHMNDICYTWSRLECHTNKNRKIKKREQNSDMTNVF